MADQNGKSGCGCCGVTSGLGCVVLLISLAAIISLGFLLFNHLEALTQPPGQALWSSDSSQQIYAAARQRLGNFLSTSNANSVTLSAADVNSLLADTPELWFLRRRATVAFQNDVIEVHLTVPVLLPGTKYFSWVVFMRPVMRGENVALDITRIEQNGRVLDYNALRFFKTNVEPYLNQALSGLNKIQGDRPIRDLRVERDSLVLLR
jgi:hypothetical protein